MKIVVVIAAVLLAACTPPPPETVRAIAETCAKQGMVARLDGSNGSVYCVKP